MFTFPAADNLVRMPNLLATPIGASESREEGQSLHGFSSQTKPFEPDATNTVAELARDLPIVSILLRLERGDRSLQRYTRFASIVFRRAGLRPHRHLNQPNVFSDSVNVN